MTHEEFVEELVKHIAETVSVYENNAGSLIIFSADMPFPYDRIIKISIEEDK